MSWFEDFGLAPSACLADRIRIESVEDDQTLVLKDGSLASIIRIEGAFSHDDKSGLADVAEALRVSMAPFLSRPGHALEFTFARDPVAAQRNVEQAVNRSRSRAAELCLELQDVLDGSERRLANMLAEETCLAVIFTRPVRNGEEERRESAKTAEQRSLSGATRHEEIPAVYARHTTLTEALCRDLRVQSRAARVLNIVEALREIRASLYPFTAPWKQAWKPRLFESSADGERIVRALGLMPSRPRELEGTDFSNLLPAPLDRQLATEDAVIVEPGIVRIGDALFSGFDVTVAPEVLMSFDSLVEAVSASPMSLSWRCRFLIESGGLQTVRLREQFARLFAFAAPVRNTRIRDAISALREIDGVGDTVVRLRISFATWSRVGELRVLRRKSAILKRAVERWGNASVDSVTGDPLAAILSSMAGLGPESTAPAAAAPLSGAIAMLPLSRQASPWIEGPVIFRTADGKAWPYCPGSSQQNSWVDIYSGSPGSGKSVAMHSVNLACALAPHVGEAGSANLPCIAILDIGRSSKGFVDLVKEALPAERRGDVMHLKLRMTQSHAINPFDTPLGIRCPLAAGRSFLVNFLATLCGSDEMGGACPIAGMSAAAVDYAYEKLADGGSPKRYIEGEVPEVDQALKTAGIAMDEFASWWNVTDALFLAGCSEEAAKAQTRAVPVLADLASACQADHIAALYSGVSADSGAEPVLQTFQRRIAEALREFRILAGPTCFDAGSARIAALDLDEVSGVSGGAAAERRTALIYMLARQFMIGHWLIDEDEISRLVTSGHCPKRYLAHHHEKVRLNRRSPKLLCIDEFHRTGGLAGFRRQVLQDIREGRKNNMRLTLASQLLDDFGEEILDVASSFMIFDAPSGRSVTAYADRWGLGPAEIDILRRKLTGPTSRGAPFFTVMRHKCGVVRQLLYLTIGAHELWSLSTTPEDTALRTLLIGLLGPVEARVALAGRFPSGSAKSEIEKRVARRMEQGIEFCRNGVIESLAQELAEQIRHYRMAKSLMCDDGANR